MDIQENLMRYIKENLSYDIEENIRLFKEVYQSHQEESLSEEEKSELQNMYVRCRQIVELRDSFGLDISELNPKEYILNAEYAGICFLDDLEKWKYCFEKARSGDASMALLIGNYFREGKFSKPMTVCASKWYKIAAEKGLPNGMYELGMCYRWGEDRKSVV